MELISIDGKNSSPNGIFSAEAGFSVLRFNHPVFRILFKNLKKLRFSKKTSFFQVFLFFGIYLATHLEWKWKFFLDSENGGNFQ